MKKRDALLIPSLVLLSLISCTSNGIKLTNEDKKIINSTSFEYVDYGENGTTNWDTNKWYKNELKNIPLPDPAVIEEDGTYYIYGTTDRTAAKTFDCYSTTDFNSFTLHKNVYAPTVNSITQIALFAPEVYKIDGKFYMYYSGKKTDSDKSGVNVLVSDSPTGPFIEYKGKNALGEDVDYTSKMMITDVKSGLGLSILDQTLLIDDDEIYMYYSVYDTGNMQYIVGFKMLDPVTPDLSTYKILLRPGELSPTTTRTNILDWECMKSFKVAEGPIVMKSPKNGKYYMTYSVNHYPDRFYTVCYAESESPLGDYIKPYEKGSNWSNLFFGYAGPGIGTIYDQWEGFTSGTAHHFIFKAGDEYMIAYHAHKNRKDSSSGRVVGFDHVYFDENGVPYTQGPSTSLQPLPYSISGYKNVATKAKIITENVENISYINDEKVVEHYNLEQEKDKEVILKKGKAYIKFKLDKKYKIGGIQVVNSAFFDKMIDTIKFIKLGNGNNIVDGVFDGDNYVDLTKDFIYPDSNFTFDFENVETDEITFCFEIGEESLNINEIKIFGEE